MHNDAVSNFFVALFCFWVVSATWVSGTFDSITPSQPVHDGETIISAGGEFELGFFSPGDPSKRYVGIWYKKVTTVTVAWVANRLVPITDGKGVLRVTGQGNVILQNGNGGTVWSSNTTLAVANSPSAQLLDSGNLVVRNGIDEDLLWQSFDYPTDTVLSGMKIGINRTSGFDRYLTSWRSSDDPYPGSFTYKLDTSGYPEMMLWQGSKILFRRGPWNGMQWSGTANLDGNRHYSLGLVLTDKEIYFLLEKRSNDAVTLRPYLSPNGVLQTFTWTTRKGWMLFEYHPTDTCDKYGLCGPHGTCIITDSPACTCLKGFIPKFPQEWDSNDWLHGCVRRKNLECRTDIFVRYEGMKLPNTHYSWFNRSMSLPDCRNKCHKNCSCMGYSVLDIRDEGSGCIQWFGDLVDMRSYMENGQDIYIRMSARESGLLESNSRKQKLTIGMGFGFASVIIGLGFCIQFLFRRKANEKKHLAGTMSRFQLGEITAEEEALELPLFNTAIVLAATSNLSINNKIGEGGFGPVYKGVLEDGREIAVKKLSASSKQGLGELKNEVIYIAKLQHRNLVKLYGCCLQEQNLLIYEYMPNGSLDSFIFDPIQRKLLDWKKRFDIVIGIARGLVYLHHDSRLRIIHRDIKASNILLDDDLNPKISDFGLAKGFIGNETGANTAVVVGTYGYMSPEYAIRGTFSVKSDVFSYGVLVLEIVSGQRNRGFYHEDHFHNLLGHAWKLFVGEREPLELLDKEIVGSHDAAEVLRCIQVGLLCVQRCPEDRPSMDKVLLMLGSEIELPLPKEPGFFSERNPFPPDGNSPPCHQPRSFNKISISQLTPR